VFILLNVSIILASRLCLTEEQGTCPIGNVRFILDTKLNDLYVPLFTNAWFIQVHALKLAVSADCEMIARIPGDKVTV
jgi:hypothetical protein